MKKQSLFFKLFIALALFIAVPVIVIASILSYESVSYSEDEISKSAIGKLKASEKLKGQLEENLTQRALEMTIGSNMSDLNGLNRYSEIFSNPEGIMKFYQLQNELIDLANTSTSLHSVYLYIDNSDYIFTSSQGVLSMNDFADTGWMSAYEDFRKTKTGSNWMSTRTVRFSKSTEGELGPSNKVITFFYTFTPYTTSVKGVLVFNIYEQSIRKLLNDSNSPDDGYIFVANTSGDIISHIDDDMIGRNIRNVPYMKEIMGSDSSEGHLIDLSGNKRKLVTYYKSSLNEWIYIGVYPVDRLMARINSLKAYTVYVCFALILAGILVSYFISKRIYSPLNKLLQEIRVKKGIDMKSSESDMSILSKAYDNLLKEEARLFSILEHKDNLKDAYLKNILEGKHDEGLGKEVAGIDFNSPEYICVVILIDRYHDFESVYTREQQVYMRRLILKVSEELFNTRFKCAGTVYDKKRIALLINFDSMGDEAFKSAVREIFMKVQAEIYKIMDNTITVGIGSRQECDDGAGDSFEKAQEALRYKLVKGCGSINFWQDINIENTAYYYPFVHEKHIFNILNAGIRDRLSDVINEMVQEIKDNREMHYDNVLQVFNQLIGNTVKYLLDAHCNMGMIFGNNYNIYNILSRKETLDEIGEWLIEIFSAISDYLLKVRGQSKSYFERALDYIYKNYKSDMDINSVAEYAGISYSHLRKIFKDETGENIVNYINNLRIKESKRLLCMTGMTIREISQALGYNNDQSFVRFFKKYEGIAPGEFRISGKLPEASSGEVTPG